jgi:hypothetical protein
MGLQVALGSLCRVCASRVAQARDQASPRKYRFRVDRKRFTRVPCTLSAANPGADFRGAKLASDATELGLFLMITGQAEQRAAAALTRKRAGRDGGFYEAAVRVGDCRCHRKRRTDFQDSAAA